MEFTPQRHQSARVPGAFSTPARYAPMGFSINTSLACFVEFREARDRLLAQVETAAPAPDRRGRLTGRAHPLETSFDWLLSAAALGAVLRGILSL